MEISNLTMVNATWDVDSAGWPVLVEGYQPRHAHPDAEHGDLPLYQGAHQADETF